MKKPIVTTHPDFAAAIGAWVTAEMRATMAEPKLLLNEAGQVFGAKFWDGVVFEEHLKGMLSDIIEYCGPGNIHVYGNKPCKLIVVPHRNVDVENPYEVPSPCTDHEWQICAVGHARFETGE